MRVLLSYVERNPRRPTHPENCVCDQGRGYGVYAHKMYVNIVYMRL